MNDAELRRYNRFLLLVAGLGGLLFGVDVGIIASALPYLQATSGLNADQLSVVVAAVLLGATISTLFAGWLADWLGRRLLMIICGAIFVISIPMIALSHGYGPLVLGRLCQGVSGGLIGVVVPLYLAECLPAATRGKGTAIFQWLLTLGIVAAALAGMYFSLRVAEVAKLGNAKLLFAFKDQAWRSIFWVSMPPGLVFLVGSFFLAESPRWLYKRGRHEQAQRALERSRSLESARVEMAEIVAAAAAEDTARRSRHGDSLLQRKYVIPFILACVILALNQATGVNTIIGYNTNILIQSGLSDVQAHWGYIVFTLVNFLVTIVGMMLVDRRGRKFLLVLGTGGVVIALVWTGLLFHRNERQAVSVVASVRQLITPRQSMTLQFTPALEQKLLAAQPPQVARRFAGRTASLTVIYAYGGFQFASPVLRSDQTSKPVVVTRRSSLPANGIVAFFSNPFASLARARAAPLVVRQATLTPLPSERSGWIAAASLFFFMACFAIGPGIVVWLALSELMPTRIRSQGMSIALLLNEGVSTVIAAMFLPAVGQYGYAAIFFVFAGFTVVYFLVAWLWLPETKGKRLEEIEAFFQKGPHPGRESVQA
ncbi:MAG: MFS transporter [Terriglobales bacterium]